MSKSSKDKGGAGDGRFFSTTKKGETQELRAELQSASREKKVDAVKKVIANMTVGKDVSMLFTDIVNCIQTGNIELKKLVYLYLINYAKTQPEMALLAVNTFVKDANDPNPLVRALAIRTMGCIRVEKITEYLMDPLLKCIRDDDPYVRKTAAVCVAKMYDISPELVLDRGLVNMLRDMVSDANPTVVANAVAALNEIAETSGDDSVLELSSAVLSKLLAALNECTEWGQVSILDALSKYEPTSARDAESIVDRVSPRLQHANSAVVMSAVKVIIKFARAFDPEGEAMAAVRKKLAPPLVTLLNSEPEICYVALRNMNLIVQHDARILEAEIKVFFCKYNDPIYVKLEKLEIMIRLVSERNVEQVLLELKEYAREVDVDFVRRAVRAIGRCAIKLDVAAQRCINALLELIETKVNYVVQEAVVVTKDIFRRYPNRYEAIIATLCENLESLDEPEAKAAMVWIIGEYAEQIENADDLLESFLDTFSDDAPAVQLQLLTAAVKLFLKAPTLGKAHDLVQKALHLATEAHGDNPDLRDRGYIYWRLLSANPDAAKAVVLAEKPSITDDTSALDPQTLEDLLGRIATLASVYHQPPEAFVMREATHFNEDEAHAAAANADETYDDFDDGPIDDGGGGGARENGNISIPQQQQQQGSSSSAPEVDLLDMGILDMGGGVAPHQAPFGGGGGGGGGNMKNHHSGGIMMGMAPAVAKVPVPPPQLAPVCAASQASGLVGVRAAFSKREGAAIALELDFSNASASPISGFMIQFNKSPFGVAPVAPQIAFGGGALMPQGSAQASVRVQCAQAMVAAPVGALTALEVQVAMKNASTGLVFYFTVPLPFDILWSPDGAVDRTTFIESWKKIDDSHEIYSTVSKLPSGPSIEAAQTKLVSRDAHSVARRHVPNTDGHEVVYFSIKTLPPVQHHFLVELTFKAGFDGAKVCVKTTAQPFAVTAKNAIENILLSHP